MKSLKSVFLSGGVLSHAQMTKLRKTWKWEHEGFVAFEYVAPGTTSPVGYKLITREEWESLAD